METDQEQARLVMLEGPHPEKIFALAEDEITVGREMQNTIVISDPEISRRHARLRRTAEGYTIEDLGSTNGTFVNGARITRAVPVTNGDRISLGETVHLVYRMTIATEDETVIAGVGTVTPPVGEFEMPEEPMEGIEVPEEPPMEASPPQPVEPMEPVEPYEGEILEPPPPFDEPAAAESEEESSGEAQEPPPAPEPPFEVEREIRPTPLPPYEPGVPSRYEEPRESPSPPPYEPSRAPARESGRPTPPSGEPYRRLQHRQQPPPALL